MRPAGEEEAGALAPLGYWKAGFAAELAAEGAADFLRAASTRGINEKPPGLGAREGIQWPA